MQERAKLGDQVIIRFARSDGNYDEAYAVLSELGFRRERSADEHIAVGIIDGDLEGLTPKQIALAIAADSSSWTIGVELSSGKAQSTEIS